MIRVGNIILSIMLAGLTILLFGLATITVNASYSAPHWGYFRLPVGLWPLAIKRGDWVQFTPPVKAEWPYVKQVRGVAGDTVDVQPDRIVTINGACVGVAKTHSFSGRIAAAIKPVTIDPAYFFVSTPHKDSHDSRYEEIGLIPSRAILARVWPLPNITWLGLRGNFALYDDSCAS